MSEKSSPQKVIESYRRRRQPKAPVLFGVIGVVLVVVGLLALALWLTGPGTIELSFLHTATQTPTFTQTPTPVTPTRTPTITATATLTSTATYTPTPSEPYEYIIQEGETLVSIAEKFDVDLLILMTINHLTNDSIYKIGDTILIPAPDTKLPTSTPLPDNLKRGDLIQYMVLPGDSVDAIALRFNSTIEAILKANESLTDQHKIFVGQILFIPVNLVTPLPTAKPTITPTP